MAYNMPALFNTITEHLDAKPRVSLCDLARELGVGRRTIEKSVKMMTGKYFCELRRGLLLTKVRDLLARDSTRSIKEISFAIGYKSPRSFARSIKNTCGCCPSELRLLLENDPFISVGSQRPCGIAKARAETRHALGRLQNGPKL